MTIRPQRPGDTDHSLGEGFERTRSQERLSSGIWVVVGSGDPLPDGPDLDGNVNAPAYENGWGPAGGGKIPLSFKWVVGGGIDLLGSADGGAVGSRVFRLPNHPLYLSQIPGEARVTASDNAGNLLVLRIIGRDVYAGL